MESNINLESYRDLSESQLEALLRYESPPETPIQPTGSLLQGHPSPKDLNSTTNVEANSFNFLSNNREQLGSQINTQIDFSIFHHCSPNADSFPSLNMEINENENSIFVASQIDFVDNSPILISDKEVSNIGDEYFNEPCCSHRKDNDFGEINDKIDSASNLEISHINDLNWIQRKCQTQLNLKNSHKKIISSCPTYKGKYNEGFSFISGKELFKGNSKSLSLEGSGELNSVISGGIKLKEDENENKVTSPFLSWDQSTCGNSAEMYDIFETSNSEHILGDPSSLEYKARTDSCNEDKTNSSNCSTKSFKNIKLQIDALSIPLSVRQLYDIVKTNYSDFAFIYALSSQLYQDRVPMECFVTLKIGLLLSLVSIGNNENRPPIPIVAITNDTYMTDYLMTNIGQLGSRFLGPMDETKSPSNVNWVEADPILLARGGVYYAGDWTRLKLRRAETIFKNIECSSVAMEKSTLTFPLDTAIWTHWRSFKYGAKDQQTFNKFLKIFGVPIFVSDDNHDGLIDYTLEQSSVRIFESTVDHLSINEEDMHNFLVCVSQNNVDLSPEAALVLKNYFVASRSIRQDCLSKQSYSMLKQFAESFAKLSMRKEVLYEDALAAIIMCEHFIENIFGSSNISPPHFGNFNFVGAVDTYLLEFKKWLNSYIEKFANE